MKRLYEYLPNQKFVFELDKKYVRDVFEDKKEVDGALYLLPNLKWPTTQGTFPVDKIGKPLTEDDIFELKKKHTRNLNLL